MPEVEKHLAKAASESLFCSNFLSSATGKGLGRADEAQDGTVEPEVSQKGAVGKDARYERLRFRGLGF